MNGGQGRGAGGLDTAFLAAAQARTDPPPPTDDDAPTDSLVGMEPLID